MLVRVVQKPSTAPTSDDEAEIAWSSSYGETQLDDAEDLSGSVLSSVLPDFEVGAWYALADFVEKLSAATVNEAPSWTILEIISKDIVGSGIVEIPAQQGPAALMICRAVVDHLYQTDRHSDIWIRVE
jgi:hypothetical protein